MVGGGANKAQKSVPENFAPSPSSAERLPFTRHDEVYSALLIQRARSCTLSKRATPDFPGPLALRAPRSGYSSASAAPPGWA